MQAHLPVLQGKSQPEHAHLQRLAHSQNLGVVERRLQAVEWVDPTLTQRP